MTPNDRLTSDDRVPTDPITDPIQEEPALAPDETNESPDEIRAEMAQTRAEMSATISAIQERLDPERLKRQATETVREATDDLKRQAAETVREATIGKAEHFMSNVEDTARETGYNLVDAIRQNPIPAALVGVGLAWMFLSGPDRHNGSNRPSGRYTNNSWSTGPEVYHGMDAPRGTPRPMTGTMVGAKIQDAAQTFVGQAGSQVQDLGQKAHEVSDQAKDQVGNLGNQVQDTVQQLGSRAQGTIQDFGSRAQGQVEGMRNDLQDQVQSVSSDFQRQAQWMSTNFDRMLHQTPLALGAVALAVGAAVGMVAPQTPHEDQLMGEARDQFMNKANDAAHDALDKVQKVADKVQASATEAVKNETSGSSKSESLGSKPSDSFGSKSNDSFGSKPFTPGMTTPTTAPPKTVTSKPSGTM